MKARYILNVARIALGFLVCAVLLAGGCGKQNKPAPEWTKLPQKDWPQIVLTNDIAYKDGQVTSGASAFLIFAPNGDTLACTARHLLRPAMDITPEVRVDEFNHKLDRWTMFPRTKQEDSLEVESLVNTWLPVHYDWAVFSIRKNRTGAQPLRVPSEPIAIDDTCFLVACQYSDYECAQAVYPLVLIDAGKLPAEEDSTESVMWQAYYTPENIEISGMSGAPIITRERLFVGTLAKGMAADLEDTRELGGFSDAQEPRGALICSTDTGYLMDILQKYAEVEAAQ